MPIQKWSEQIWVVQLSGEPMLSEDLISLPQQAYGGDDAPHCVISMEDVAHLNSTNLSQLLRLRKAATDHGAKLVLATVPDAVWVVFLTTGLDNIFEFAPDVATALASLQLSQ